MKKAIVALAVMAAIWGCGGSENKPSGSDAKAPAADNPPADPTKNPDYTKGLALVAQSDCLGCHKINEAATGPAYTAVAKKYAGQPGAVDMLAQKIIKGGAGNWGQIPMAAHPQVSEEDAKAMVKYVLTLNQ